MIAYRIRNVTHDDGVEYNAGVFEVKSRMSTQRDYHQWPVSRIPWNELFEWNAELWSHPIL